MNDKTLTISSLLAILFFSFHWAYDIVFKMAPGDLSALFGILILVVWLYGTLVVGDRRSGCIIMLLGGLSGLFALVLHLRGAGLVGPRVANSSGVFLWVWTLLALGGTSAFSTILAARALWKGARAARP
ncbi:hypothetical protein Acid345_4011 [Candidatus Koribacter versatilis Ellin345]|uniref:Transmembrane protein n=1 Tax=Koribacter versatilis (strain Ellin345) TaxID=204669 RepID=Q1IJD9_KORVE|nr:hypothetical protein [Candidatus Koribacter versatilis]ABF43011.1 hypothetical protein Acid345_4011 [Candidatus Koribacter versatilis Ellin345]